MPSYAVILPAAGSSRRFGYPSAKKQFAKLAGQPVWLHAANQFLNRNEVKQFIVVVAQQDREDIASTIQAKGLGQSIEICLGGEERADSIGNALARVDSSIDLVAIHDAARPCLASIWIDRVFAAAHQHGAAILATPAVATLKRVKAENDHPAEKRIVATVDRTNIWLAQTPQVFRRELLLEAYAAGPLRNSLPTDDAQLVEQLGKPVVTVEGSPLNLKITTQDDLKLAECILRILPKV